MIRKAWLTTSWDDGHPLDFKIADMLSRFGLTGTFYIPHSAPNITMSREQIRDLGSAFEIGSHTINHVFLDGATDEQARTEIIDSKAWVQDVMGRREVCRSRYQAYPRGRLQWVPQRRIGVD
jgi:peptidoglycan/xylan/chitin deacetylase (PgdA/CDA1 family)